MPCPLAVWSVDPMTELQSALEEPSTSHSDDKQLRSRVVCAAHVSRSGAEGADEALFRMGPRPGAEHPSRDS